MTIFTYKIKDELGIHARPAGLLAKAAKNLESEITITHDEKTAGASKLLAVMGLGVKQGDIITVTINGGDEAAAEKVIRELLEKSL